MSSDVIKYGSVSGEISRTLFGRSDLEQYDLAWAKAENWFVNYQGGLSTRPGLEFCDFVKDDDKDTKFFEFQFSPATSNVYVVLFGHNYVRFIQDGGYVLEADKTITSVAVASDVVTVTATAHGYENGDWVKIFGVAGMTGLEGRSFVVANKTTDTFELKTYPANTDPMVTGTAGTGGVAARVYTLASPYAATGLNDLRASQRRDLLRLTDGANPIRNLRRIDHANWIIEEEPIAASVTVPTGLTVTPSSSGDAGALFAVTAVDKDGRESVMTKPVILNNSVNWTVTSGSVEVQWNVTPGAVYYNVYRSLVHRSGDDITLGIELGFIGKTYGTSFTDNNIIPDFTKAPPIRYNPFAPGAIKNIFVTAPGTDYDKTDGMSVTGTGGGSGFSGFPIVSHEKVTGVLIRLPGSGYIEPVTIAFSTGSGGTGATATAELTPLTGTYPTISAVFQQRQLYAASPNEPLTIWGSRPNQFTNFDYSAITNDSDSYEYELDSEQIAPIRHMIPMRGGLVVMSQVGVWQFTGNPNGVVTPKNAIADPQNYTGVSLVEPIRVNTDLLYIEGKGYTVRLLSYNDYARVYNGEDRSLLSNHLFGVDKQIVRWTFAENPFKLVWAARSDGRFLSFCIVKDEKIFGWTPHSTRGKVLDVCNALEEGLDRTYFMVQRYINGRNTKFIERMDSRKFDNAEEAFCVDCGLRLGHTYPNQTLTVLSQNLEERTAIVSTGSSFWSEPDVGKIIRAGGAKLRITSFISDTQVSCEVLRPFTDYIPQDPLERVYPQAPGTWTQDTPVSLISGLWHLEGEPVAVLADGNVIENLAVTNGQIALPSPATKVYVGLSYSCIAQTLPPVVSDAIIESRRKRVVEIGVRLDQSRGLRNGERLEKLYEMKERTNELMGEPTNLQSGTRLQLLEPRWDSEGQTYLVQRYPLPATILALVRDIEVGDDKD